MEQGVVRRSCCYNFSFSGKIKILYKILGRESFVEFLAKEVKSKKTLTLRPSLQKLKDVVTQNMIKKVGNAGIDFQMRLTASEDNENKELEELLSEVNDFNFFKNINSKEN